MGRAAASILLILISASSWGRVLTEAEIIKAYVESGPKLQALKDTYLAASENVSRAKSSIFPTIDVTASVVDSRTSGNTALPFGPQVQNLYTGSINLNQPLFTSGKLKSGLDIAKLTAMKAEQDYLTAKQQALSDLLTAAYNLGGNAEKNLVLQDSQRFEQNYTSITRGKVARGSARAYELSQAEAQLASYEPQLRNVVRDISHSRSQLMIQLQIPELNSEKDPIDFRLQDPKPYEIPSPEQLLRTANENRPEIRALEFAKQQAEAQKIFDLADDLPNLSFAASLGDQSASREEFFDGKSQTYSFGLNLKIPIFSGLSSIYKYRAAAYTISAAERNLAEQRRQVQIEVEQEYENTKAAHDVFVSTEAWSKKARQALEQSLQSYRVGTISSVQVNQIQASREQAALAYAAALLEYHTSLLRMRKAIGVDLEKAYTGGK